MAAGGKIKLLFMLTNMNVGGTEKSFLNLIDSINRDKYDVTLLLLENYGGFMRSIPDWVAVKYFDYYEYIKHLILDPPLPQIRALFHDGKVMTALSLLWYHFVFKLTHDRSGYYRYLLKGTNLPGEYDAAVAYTGPFDVISLFVLENIKAEKKIQWIHFDVKRASFNVKFAKHYYMKFDRIFTVSDEGKASLTELVPEVERITRVFHNVVSRNIIEASAEKECPMADDKRIKLLTVGRLTGEKGQIMVPEILSRLVSEGRDVVWYLVGYGAKRGEIEKAAEKLGVADRLIITGQTTNPYPYYRCCDIYVQTSFHEGYCITLTEARCFDRPIITTDFSCAGEQITHGENGLISKAEPESLYKAVVRLLDDGELYDKISQKLRFDEGDFSRDMFRLDELFSVDG